MDHRYSRQILLNHVGKVGQEKLNNSKVLVVGMGELGTVVVNHLVRSGIGHVSFVDDDRRTNQHHILYDEEDERQGLSTVAIAERKLQQINSSVNIEGIISDITPSTISKFADDVDLILLGTDDVNAQLLMNDYCFKAGIPYIYGDSVGFKGVQATFIPGETPCLRCLVNDSTTKKVRKPGKVISPISDIVACFQTLDAIKYLVGKKETIQPGLLTMNSWDNENFLKPFEQPKEACLCCGAKVYPSLHESN
ncbi:ThiF family adenylyltransferase [Desertibacillus haloalkaliphilus]|uniref:ThiF family adenylyltransferase n=1 Tax=Desertibacillus haloalkaliphilus TaxID=1328930 RepID=UPI001C269F26|nr:ThiF family adenylyltransferase [Desertibacillus haloalkaliphilus]MBU8906040.1 ThiF family adenylyltransferase [Desertibacillus haloalkaliphilus]